MQNMPCPNVNKKLKPGGRYDGNCVWVSVSWKAQRYSTTRSFNWTLLMQVIVLTCMCVTCTSSGNGTQQQDVKPAKPKEKHMVKISSSGPAVLDSLVTFVATVTNPDGQVEDKKLYKYEWSNTADYAWRGLTSDNDRSVMTVAFPKEDILPGPYNMTVSVFKLENDHGQLHGEHIGDGHCIFKLTSKINGNLTLYQESKVDDAPGVFATGRDIVATASFSDKFLRIYSIMYTWTTESSGTTEENITTSHPNITLSFNKTGEQFIGVHIKAHVLAEDGSGSLKNMTKVGPLDAYATFLDPVTSLSYSGSTAYQAGAVLNGSFSCEGSPPVDFRVCLSMEDHRGNFTNKSCQYSFISRICQFPVRYKLDRPGVYLMTGEAKNVVSLQVQHVRVHVPQTVPPEAAPVLIPLACVGIGLSIIIAMLATYYRDKRKEHVETADFDFHTVHDGPAPWLQNLRHTLASLLRSRNNYNSGGVREYRPSTARNYGALGDNVL